MTDRPNETQACCLCEYWECDLTPIVIPRGEHVFGRCCRHAPVVPSIAVHTLGNLIGLVAYATEETANIEHDKDADYEFADAELDKFKYWPEVAADNWCGDYKPRETSIILEESKIGEDSMLYDRASSARHKIAEQWEAENHIKKSSDD